MTLSRRVTYLLLVPAVAGAFAACDTGDEGADRVAEASASMKSGRPESPAAPAKDQAGKPSTSRRDRAGAQANRKAAAARNHAAARTGGSDRDRARSADPLPSSRGTADDNATSDEPGVTRSSDDTDANH